MKKWSLAFLALALMLLLAACGDKKETTEKTTSGDDNAKTEQSTEMTITHELGETVLPKTPEKVVVFDFGLLDTLDTLGVEVAGVPQSAMPPYLEKYAGSEYTNLGSLKEPDFEAIHALKPDVIFISTRQADLYDQFAEIAPTIYVAVDTTNYLESYTNNIKMLGEVFNKEAEVEKELAAVTEKIEEIKGLVEGNEEKALIIMSNEGKISAYGHNSRFGLIHDVFGYKEADENIEESTHGQSVTFEYVLETNPDILFVLNRDAAVNAGAPTNNDAIENEIVQKTNAYKNGKIVYLDPAAWYLAGGGLQSMKTMIDDAEKGVK